MESIRRYHENVAGGSHGHTDCETNPRVFGSVLHGEDQDGSDLDLLVDPAPRTSLMDMAGLQIELEKTLGTKVDVRTPGELHPRFREKVLAEAAAL